jgi:hypothetical protein
VSLIVTALVVGARDNASEVVRDAYAALRALLDRYVADTPGGSVALEQHERDPDTWQAPVSKVVKISGAANDPDILEDAQRVLELVDPVGTKKGRYAIDVMASGSRSVSAPSTTGSVVTGDTDVFLGTIRGDRG